jgi:hypothetical protein
MHPVKSLRFLLPIAAVAALWTPAWGQRAPILIPVDDNFALPLRAEGVDPNDESALIGALRRPDGAAFLAAVILGSRPANPAVDQALLEAARPAKEKLTSRDELNLSAAVYALARHGEFGYADEVARRLPAIQDPDTQLWLAGNLAIAGRYDGWPLIKSAITTGRNGLALMQVALTCLLYFDGMKDKEGRPVNLAEELNKMAAVAPYEHRQGILGAMSAVRRLKAR